ncbi:MAG: glycoside hydrolase family 97 protein [Parvularculaceae bacterium]|nr:glycoside hydrolase family 97 protein [Parvularculaceae bacterium]
MKPVAAAIVSLAAGIALGLCAVAAAAVTVASPNGDIVVTISDEAGIPSYSVSFRDEQVIKSSRLGMRFKNAPGLDRGLAIASSAAASKDETWEQPWGERRFVRDHHNELFVEFAAADNAPRRLGVRFRAFNDGVGFRYEVPRAKNFKTDEVTNEMTEFVVDESARVWWIPARYWNRYEYLYRESSASDELTSHTPMTLKTPSGAHLSIHEASLVDYSAMALRQIRPGRFKAELAPWSDGALVKFDAPLVSPWRTIQISPDAKGLLNSSLILNLNEPNKIGDVSWFEPGKYVGVWWEMHIRDSSWGMKPLHGATNENVRRYIDFAAKYGFNGVLVEGWNLGWDDDWFGNGKVFDFTKSYPDFDLSALAAYAREKGVRLIGHHETGGAATHYERQMDDAFKLYEQNGVHVVKTGYVADGGGIQRIDEKGIERFEWHDGQFMARHHLEVVKAAARHKIAINPHEPIKDTGLRRTYPNWVAREGARGQEYNAWGPPPNPPEHEPTIAFTRMLAGPMDFTPGIFDLEPNKRAPVREDMTRSDPKIRVETTLAKQLALYVVLYSPIQMAADLPENYERRRDAFQFIVDVPTDWEESVGLAGEIGDYVVMARKRRGGDDWYVGAVSDEKSRDVAVDLAFLDEGKTYVAEIYRDGAKADWKTNPYDLVIEKKKARRGEALRVRLAAGGGAAIRLTPATEQAP